MRISPTVFAEALFHSTVAEELKTRILHELPTMPKEKINELYRILRRGQSKREQERLKLEVHIADEWTTFQTALAEVRQKLG